MPAEEQPVTGTLPGPASSADLQTEVLEDLAGAVNYRRWLSGLAMPWLGDDPLEIGSGSGDYASEWADAVARLTVSEADPARLARLRRRFAADRRVVVRELVAPTTETASHSSVVAYNVLEHIEDDVAALRGFANLLAPDGHVVLIVPAVPAAMSRFDREIGHHRRYTRAGLARVLRQADLQPAHLRYVNAPGLVAWIIGMRLLGMRPRAGRLLSLWDGLVPSIAHLERRWEPPVGQSLFAVAVRADRASGERST